MTSASTPSGAGAPAGGPADRNESGHDGQYRNGSFQGETTVKNNRAMPVIVAGLVIVCGVLAYLLYQERQKSVSINLPGVKIEAN